MSDVEFPSPTPRRVAKPSWLDVRLVLGVGLVAAAVLLGAVVVARARHTDRDVAVNRDLAAGTTLHADDLRLVDVALPASGRRAYLRSTADAIGKVLTRPLGVGELVPVAALEVQTPRTTVTVPFAADAAPDLHRGQRIVVWLSTPACPSVVLLNDVTVQDVHSADAATFAGAGGGQAAVLTVTPQLAERVVGALAIRDAAIRAGVLTGSGQSAPADLPALDTCGAAAQ